MHGAETFLQDLAVVMITAGLVTVLFRKLKQPVVLGYIVAGFIIGPHTPPFPLVRDEAAIKTLADLGVLLLMFSLGLEFSLRKLRKVGGPAFIAAFFEILLMGWIGYEIGRSFGWRLMDCIFMGAMLSISSTTIIVRALAELGKSKETFAELIFGILIIEDILAIIMIALLSGIAMTGTLNAQEVGLTVGRLMIFLVVALVVGLLFVPRLLSYVASFKSDEMLLITVLGLCFGVSLLALKLKYSVALGAFIIGAVMAESREIHQIESLIAPVRDMFSAMFFVAIGLLIDPAMLIQHWQVILVVTVAVVIGKIAACSFGTFAAGQDIKSSLRVGMSMAQIGEFSFIIASLGLTLGVTSSFLYPVAVAVSALTTLLTPYLIKSTDWCVAGFVRVAPPKFVASLELYTRWVGSRERRHTSLASKLVRKWSYQMALNAVLLAGLFIAAAFVSLRWPALLADVGIGSEGQRTVFWLGAMIAALPLLIATFRKLQAFGMLVSEMTTIGKGNGPARDAARALIAPAISLFGTIGLGLYVLFLSSALLPTWRVLMALLILIAIIAVVFWRSFTRLYSKAQFSLVETLRQPPAAPPEAVQPLKSMLRDAVLETLALDSDSPAVQKPIGELKLRTTTGATIVGIDRDGSSIINPGPSDELRPGDKVLLLGLPGQLAAAKAMLLPS